MVWQENKVTNLKLAVKRLDGLILYPGETFSYWKRIGKPTARKGYKEGMVLFLGQIGGDIGGGLCQLSTKAWGANRIRYPGSPRRKRCRLGGCALEAWLPELTR